MVIKNFIRGSTDRTHFLGVTFFSISFLPERKKMNNAIVGGLLLPRPVHGCVVFRPEIVMSIREAYQSLARSQPIASGNTTVWVERNVDRTVFWVMQIVKAHRSTPFSGMPTDEASVWYFMEWILKFRGALDPDATICEVKFLENAAHSVFEGLSGALGADAPTFTQVHSRMTMYWQTHTGGRRRAQVEYHKSKGQLTKEVRSLKNEQAMIMKLFESRVTMAPAPALTPVPAPVSPDPVAVHPVAVHPVASSIAVVESLRAQVTAVMSPDQAERPSTKKGSKKKCLLHLSKKLPRHSSKSDFDKFVTTLTNLPCSVARFQGV